MVLGLNFSDNFLDMADLFVAVTLFTEFIVLIGVYDWIIVNLLND